MPDRPTHPSPIVLWHSGLSSGAPAAPATGTARAICPDLLSIRDLGAADGWRGHLVRGMFRVLRVVTGV